VPTLLRHRLEIRLDQNLDGLFAGINLDTYGASPKSTSWRRPFSRRMMAWGIIVSLSAIGGDSGTINGEWRDTYIAASIPRAGPRRKDLLIMLSGAV
jgi:hypothetical protein